MRIVKGPPPNYDKICERFPHARNTECGLFCYGDTLYITGPCNTVSFDFEVHEKTHSVRQQEMGIEAWWDRYLTDTEFMLREEVIAYGAQLRVFSKSDREKNIRRLSGLLSGPLYGSVVTSKQARKLIWEEAKNPTERTML